jgi:fucose permease
MRPNYFIILLINLIFFVLALLSSILGALLPDLITTFDLSLRAASFLPFCFYIAYGVVSIPAGILVEHLGDKKVLRFAFILSCFGALLFANLPVYWIGVLSLFLIGSAMAVLQVSINPLLRTASGARHFAFNATVTQLTYGMGAFISPYVYMVLMKKLRMNKDTSNWSYQLSNILPANKDWIILYWIFAVISFIMIVLVTASRFPKVVRTEEEQTGSMLLHFNLFKQRTVILYFVAIFMYVACEQGNANWMSQFLYTYHGYSPQSIGAQTLSWYWFLLASGCIAGMVLLKFFDSRKILIVFTLLAIVSFTVAITGPGPVSLIAFPAVGLSQSIMWPVIISLALNSVSKHHGSFSGILITAIIGGAVGPLLIGTLGDILGLKGGMCSLYVAYVFVASVGLWAKPLVSNLDEAESVTKVAIAD